LHVCKPSKSTLLGSRKLRSPTALIGPRELLSQWRSVCLYLCVLK